MDLFPTFCVERYLLGALLPCAPDNVINDALQYTPRNSAAKRIMVQTLHKRLRDSSGGGAVDFSPCSLLPCILPCHCNQEIAQTSFLYGTRRDLATAGQLHSLCAALARLSDEQHNRVGFGRHCHLALGELLTQHRSYCEWAHREADRRDPRLLTIVNFLEHVHVVEQTVGIKK